MRKVLKYLAIGSIPVAGILLFLNATLNDREIRWKEFNEGYSVFAIDLPENATFAGEKVPLQMADVRERFDRELLVNTYWQSQTLLFLKRKERWFPVIEAILKENNIPDDFKYLALAESGLTNAVSPSGAVGYWQFLEGTGGQYGLEINSDVDERYHVEKATRAACVYFKNGYAIFNSWSLVAASYNMGMDGLKKQIGKQLVTNYFDLLLSEETSRYVFRILALKEICNQPLKYGFHLRKRDFYEPYSYRSVTIDTAITDLAVFAKSQGINYKELKLLNPWLRSNTLMNKSGKQYKILILNEKKSLPHESMSDTSWIKTVPSRELHQE